MKKIQKNKKFDGKIAVISGASSGIGLAIGKKLQSLGVKVVNISKELPKDIKFFEDFICDISNDEEVGRVIEKIQQEFSKIDYLFCNAGFGIGGAVENASLSSIQKLFDVNLVAHVKMTKLFLPMICDGGRIVYTCSVASFIPLPYQACYSASKAGLESFARALSTEVRSRKIKVSAIMPGDTKTGFTDARVKETNKSVAEQRGIKKMEKWERSGKSPEGVARVALKILKKKRPPLRACVGFEVRFLGVLVRILPNRFVDFLVRKIYV